MNNKKEIARIKKISFVKKFLEDLTPDWEIQIIDNWLHNANVFSIYLENSEIDSLGLFAISDVLMKKKEEDFSLLRHSRVSQKGYDGAKEFLQLLNQYYEGDIVLTGVSFDYKKVRDKNNKRKTNSEIKSESSNSLRVNGNKMIEGILTSLLDGKIKEKTEVFGSYKSSPVFKNDEYPNKKTEFDSKHRRIAINEIISFFDKHHEIPIKQRKIFSMKVLVYIKFIDSHEDYRKQASKKKVKRVLAENEYYLQRFNELTRIR